MEPVDTNIELAKALSIHVNAAYYQALLNAFVSQLQSRCIVLVKELQDGLLPCVLAHSEKRKIGLAILAAREQFMRPTAASYEVDRWVMSSSRSGEGIAWVDRLVAALKSEGLTLAVPELKGLAASNSTQVERVAVALAPPDSEAEGFMDFFGDMRIIHVKDPTFRDHLRKAVEQADGDSEAAVNAVISVIETY